MAEVNPNNLNLKPNSHQYHKEMEKKAEEKQEDGNDIPEKKVNKIVSDPVVKKKKTFGRKLADIFISEDVGDVKSYLIYDVLVPAVKENIADAINGAIGMIFFGEVSRRMSGRNSNRNNSKVNYGGYFNSGNDRRERMPRSYRDRDSGSDRSKADDLIIASRAEAEQVLDEMYELLDEAMMERGEVKKQMVFESAKVEVSLLALSPGAKIKEHTHTEDSEWYIFLESEKIECCPKNMSHSLENQSDSGYLFVLSIKYKH